MTKADKVLAFLLRFLGVSALFALVAVLMPFSWMAATHRWLGLGEMPAAPVVEYLARSLSAFYALFGALCLVVASDLQRYRPLVRFLGEALAVMGLVALGIDLAAGLPWWWSAFEGPLGIGLGALLYFLARPNQPEGSGLGETGQEQDADRLGRERRPSNPVETGMDNAPEDLLRALQRWYARHCDGTWEHRYGIQIETCDNPGWWVRVDLVGTELQSRPFQRLAENVDEAGFPQGARWLHCSIKDGVWHGAGDETKLPTLLQAFLTWAET